MNEALTELLNRMDAICREFEEVTDTDVREQMREALDSAFFAPVPGYELPREFGMFEPEGNALVRAALVEFVVTARSAAENAGLSTREQRLRAFQDDDVLSDEGSVYDEYFGYDDSLDV